MSLDWKNIDWGALLSSKIALGAIVTIITGAAAIAGHAIPFDQQSQLSDGLSQIAGGISTIAGVWTLYHRSVAQPETTATIIPKKDPSNSSSQKAG
jgi:hypothetical protein